MINTRRLFGVLAFASGVAVMALPAHADPLFVLPDPTSTIDGLPAATQYDDFYSYSAGLLADWDGYGLITPPAHGPYDPAAGTGTISMFVYTGPVGQQSQDGVSDALAAVSGGSNDSFEGTWGDGSSDPIGEVTTVGAITGAIGGNTPVFYFDHNESPGQGADLQAYGMVQIFDPTGTTVLGTWCFDLFDDGACTDDAVTSPGLIEVSGTAHDYSVNNNTGSGKFDFYITPIGMDLSLFDADNLFTVFMHLDNLSGGFEELGILAIDSSITDVAEPGTLGLFGLGLLGLGWAGMRRRTA